MSSVSSPSRDVLKAKTHKMQESEIAVGETE